MQRIWGIDIGTTSVGFAVVDYDEQRAQGEIIRMGVRIFPEGVTEKDREPRNKARRSARLVRRQFRRRRLRRKELGRILAEENLLPPFGSDGWCLALQFDPYDLRRRAISERLEPFEIGRALYHLAKRRGFKGKRKAEEDQEERDAKKKKDEGVVAEGIAKLRQAMGQQTPGAFLAGQPKRRGRYLAREDIDNEFQKIWIAQRQHHPAILTDALRDRIHETIFYQRPTFWRTKTLGKCWLEPDAKLCLKGSWDGQQYVMLEQLNKLRLAGGNARPLEPDERAVVLRLLESQAEATFGSIRKALKPLWRKLELPTDAEFNLEAAEDKMPGNKTEATLRKIFGDSWNDHPARDRIRQEIADRLYGVRYREVGTTRIEIRSHADEDARKLAFIASIQTDWGVTPEQAEQLADMTLPSGWLRHSAKAVDNLLRPHMEAGLGYVKAVDAAYPGCRDRPPEAEFLRIFGAAWPAHPACPAIHREIGVRLREIRFRDDAGDGQRTRPPDEAWTARGAFVRAVQVDYGATKEEAEQLADLALPRDAKLPSKPADMPDLRNPTVNRALNEVRKVANNLIAAYGKPDLIRVELARDVKFSGKRLAAMKKQQAENRQRRKTAKTRLEEKGFADASDDDVEKYLLWQECKELCPYTGKKICFDDLFGSMPKFQVEHIFPLKRSGDDSFANKTLCEIAENNRKRNKTPYEYYEYQTDKWDDIRARLKSLAELELGGRGFPTGKIRRFMAATFEEAGSEEQATRLLRDTSYIAIQTRDFLAGMGVDAQSGVGKITHKICEFWNLFRILDPKHGEKNRDDHRHHAVDALAVALTSRRIVQRMSRFEALGKRVHAEGFPPPWPTLRADAEKAVRTIVVSHRVQRKLAGRLHEQTALGDTGITVTEGKTAFRIFAKRKPLADLSGSEIDDVRDGEIRRKLKERLGIADDAIGLAKKLPEATIKKALADELRLKDRRNPQGRIVRKVRIDVKRQMKVMVPLCPERKTYVEMGQNTNHHIAMYDLGGGKAAHETVSRIEVARRHTNNEAIVRRSLNGKGKLIVSLCPGDVLECVSESGEVSYHLVRKFNEKGRVFYKPIAKADEPKPEVSFGPAQFLRSEIRKVAVDPIGRVRPAHD